MSVRKLNEFDMSGKLDRVTVSVSSTLSLATADGMKAVENQLPKRDCSFRVSAGWQAMGLYLYANDNYASMLVHNYSGLYLGQKSGGTWSSKKIS